MLFEQDIKKVVYQKDLWSDQLISQSALWPKIRSSVQQNRFPHLSLISGKPGNGQLLMALSIAQALFCKNEDKPCGCCDACRKVKQVIHPDLHFSFPLNNSKALSRQYYNQWRQALNEKPYMSISDWFEYLDGEGKNANISVAEIGDFCERLSLRPYEASITVLILWLPEYLGKDSNRLLKLFEEPPSNVYIILVAEDCESLLSTVLSRAQLFRMQSIQLDEATKILAAKTNTQENTVYSVLLSADKNIHETLQQIDQNNIPNIDILKKLLQSTYTYQVKAMIEWVESFVILNREEQKKCIEWIQLLLSFVLKLKYTSNTQIEFSDNPMMQYSKKLSGSLTLEQIEKWVDLMDDCHLAIQRNANMKILMTDFCIQLSKILRTEKN